MAYYIMTKIHQFVMKTEEYKFIKQAIIISKRLLPAYSSKFSKKKYMMYQLFTILLYKVWTNKSYRDVIEIIASNPAFVNLLSLSEIPHFTTIQKFSERIDRRIITYVFNQILKFFYGLLGNRMIIDSTGFSVNYHSFYYDKRLKEFGRRVKKKYVKTTICVDDQSQLIVSYDAYFGDIHDSKEFKKTLENSRPLLVIRDMIQKKITLLPKSTVFWQ